MGRNIDYDDLSPADVGYMEQRPWLIREYELETGKSFDDSRPDSDDEDGEGSANTDAQEVKALRRKVAKQEERIEELETQLTVARAQVADLSAELEADDEDEVPPYDEWEYADLQAEVKRRTDAGREVKPEGRSTADLIKALEADDNAADAEDNGDASGNDE